MLEVANTTQASFFVSCKQVGEDYTSEVLLLPAYFALFLTFWIDDSAGIEWTMLTVDASPIRAYMV
jgi:hypothetical protein